jgi:hypothetical protein
LDSDFRWDSEAPPTTELASVEECSQPECGIGHPLATMRLVRVERCFPSVFPGTSLHGGELRGGVATSLGGVLVANIARRGQAPPWRKITPGILNLAPFGARMVDKGCLSSVPRLCHPCEIEPPLFRVSLRLPAASGGRQAKRERWVQSRSRSQDSFTNRARRLGSKSAGHSVPRISRPRSPRVHGLGIVGPRCQAHRRCGNLKAR